jgi:hypothetical protein
MLMKTALTAYITGARWKRQKNMFELTFQHRALATLTLTEQEKFDYLASATMSFGIS